MSAIEFSAPTASSVAASEPILSEIRLRKPRVTIVCPAPSPGVSDQDALASRILTDGHYGMTAEMLVIRRWADDHAIFSNRMPRIS